MTSASDPPDVLIRERCYDRYRPVAMCFCASIPSIDNQTDVLLLQHMRERFHPFNTARIVRKSLQRGKLLVDHNLALGDHLAAETLSPRVGVLYPGGRVLSELPPSERPDQLIVIDGTWHHAKTLVRDIPQLRDLPRYQIKPSQPGQYRIRREPNEMALSTLEATVAALRAIEPDTAGFDKLLGAFNQMVETQLTHPKADYGWRHNRRRSHNPLGIPRAIIDDLPNVVVAYGESEPGKTGCKRSPRGGDRRQPVYWVAKRLGQAEHPGDTFECLIQPPFPLPDHFLEHVELPASAWGNAKSIDDFRDSWKSFQRDTDTVVVYHASTLRLLAHIDASPAKSLILKSVKFDAKHEHATLDSYLNAKQVTAPRIDIPGRAGQRLSNGIAMVRHLHELAGQQRRAAVDSIQ